MKKTICLLMLAGLFAASCSSDDSSDNAAQGPVYLPLAAGNYWNYNVEVESSGSTGIDHLFIDGDIILNGNTYKKFVTESAPNGFFSGALNGNGVRQSGTRLQLTGSTSFSFSEDFPLAISVTDFTFFDSAAASGAQLGSTSGTFEQETEDGYTLKFDYTLTSVAQGNHASYAVPGGLTYTDVKEVEMGLTLTITALIDAGGFDIPFEALPQQQVLTSTQYYAQGIGAVYIDTNITYHLTDLSGFNVELPIPSSGTEHQEEILGTYSVD